MSTSQHQTASGRPLRVAPAWVGAARPGEQTEDHLLPAREAAWTFAVRRYARTALWALPFSAVLYGWSTLDIETSLGPTAIHLAAGWLSIIAMIALAGLLAGSRTRRSAVTGLLVGLAGFVLVPVAALPAGVAPDGGPIGVDQTHTVSLVAAAVTGAGWLLLGWAVLRSKLVNPADGILLMLAAASIGAGSYAVKPLPTVGALLLLAAGMGLAWTGGRMIPRD